MKTYEKLKNLRKNHHMTLKELSEKLGFAENTIHNYENGKREPDIETIKKYAEIYEININDILEEDNKVVVYEYWINNEKIDFLLNNEKVECSKDEYFSLFFEPTGDGCIGWGRYRVEMYDGDADADILDLECKDNDYKKYGPRIIERIWDFKFDDETVSLITGEGKSEQRDMWEFFDVTWDEEMDENSFKLYR